MLFLKAPGIISCSSGIWIFPRPIPLCRTVTLFLDLNHGSLPACLVPTCMILSEFTFGDTPGDGTPVRTAAQQRKKRTCKCRENGRPSCGCKRHYSQPDCNWGWDSHRECYFFGSHLYMYVTSDSHSDLSVFPLLERASRHDLLSFLHSFFTMKAYLSAILDLSDKSIVSFVIGHSNNNALVFETFDIAHENHPDVKPLFHSDRGYQYTSKSFRKKLNEAGMTQSMSRVSRCIDNGPMEAFWGMLKTEMYYLKKFQTYEELREAVSNYMDYYNNHRYQKRLNCMTPIEYRNYLRKVA